MRHTALLRILSSMVRKVVHGERGMYLLPSLLILFSNEAYSQKDTLDVYDLNLMQLSKLRVVSASKVFQNIEDIPTSVAVVTEEQIKEAGYSTLEEVLSDLPGFQFRNIQGLNSYVFQRGIPNQNNLSTVLIDGVKMNELNSGGFYGGGQYNLSNVERIEVLYGPSSVAYGTNAVTGIINIITKNPVDNRMEVKASAGTFNTMENAFSGSYVRDEKFGILASGMIRKTDKGDLRGKAGDYNWSDLMDNFENDYALDLKVQYADFTLGSNYQYKQSSTATFFKSVGSDYKDYGTSWNILFLNNYLRYNRKLLPKTTLLSTLYLRNTTVLDNTVYYIVDTAQVSYYRPNSLLGLENILNYEAGKRFSLTAGLVLEQERLSKKHTSAFSGSYEQRPPKPPKPIMVDDRLASIFLEPRLYLFKNLLLTGGIRLDQSSIFHRVLTPRSGLIYHFSRNLFRLSYTEAYRAPKSWDYTDGLGNPNLLPEKLESLESGFAFLLTRNLKIDVTGYRNRLENAINKQFLSEGYRWVNNGEISTNGLELLISHATRKLRSSLNYTYNRSRNAFGENIPEISRHTGNASMTYAFNDFLKLNLRANYVGKRENVKLVASTGSKEIAPYLVVGGAFSLVDYKGFDMQFSVRNLLNKEYYHTSNREPDRYRQPQRMFLFSVGYAFNR